MRKELNIESEPISSAKQIEHVISGGLVLVSTFNRPSKPELEEQAGHVAQQRHPVRQTSSAKLFQD